MPFCATSTEPFWISHVVPPPPGVNNCNCLADPITQTLSITAGTSAKIGVSKKICEVDVSAEVTVKAEASISTSVTIPPCRCVSFVLWRYISISTELQTNPEWVHSGCVGAPAVRNLMPRQTIKKTIHDFSPEGVRPVPHDYPIITPCNRCPGSPFLPPTTETLGTPPTDVAATVSPTPLGTLTQLDVESVFKGTEVKSAFDLALVEIRWLVQQLQPIAEAYPNGWVDVSISSNVALKGKTVNVIADLKKIAGVLVTSKAYGDIDEDGERTTADFAALSSAVFDPPPTETRLFNRMDLNADGIIDQADADLWVTLSQ